MNAIGVRALFHLAYLLVIVLAMFASETFAQIYHVKEMNTEQIKALECFFPEASSKSTAVSVGGFSNHRRIFRY
jgi:hypothetical protein